LGLELPASTPDSPYPVLAKKFLRQYAAGRRAPCCERISLLMIRIRQIPSPNFPLVLRKIGIPHGLKRLLLSYVIVDTNTITLLIAFCS
jgi:hypothetical protein